ncbi:MAG: hypothetical protein KAY24_07605, partial [Candidatus Eisenbacteria sp.]|nr:hypothetical protein [Candidatus Eisenbacteria bacterium]
MPRKLKGCVVWIIPLLLSCLFLMPTVAAASSSGDKASFAGPVNGVMRFTRAVTHAGPDGPALSVVLNPLTYGSDGPLYEVTAPLHEIATSSHEPTTPSKLLTQLIVLPCGMEAIAVTGVELPGETGPVNLPIEAVHIGRVMIMRGVSVVPVTLDLRALCKGTESPIDSVRILLSSPGGESSSMWDELEFYPPRGRASAMLSALGCPSLNHSAPALPSPQRSSLSNRGGYLIISTPAFVSELESLVEWKIQAGYDVSLVTTAETGTTREQIWEYVQTAYEEWDNPPLHLLLVGDVDDVPTWDMCGNVSDHPYACVDGDDFLPDLFVGRFSASTTSEVAVQVAKTVGYESHPDTTAGDDWFSRSLLVAGNSGSSTPVPLSRWFEEELLAAGFTAVDSCYYPPHWGGGAEIIRAAIDRGVNLVNYRGWAYGDIGWQPPTFTVDDIPTLSNGWKLPVVFSITCHTGNFGNPEQDCFGEVWLKTGTPEKPRGAVAFVGTGEHWVHSRWNDRLDIGICEAICHHGIRQCGPILAAAKIALIPQFPTEIHFDESGEESVEFYARVYNLLGDPSLELWTSEPIRLQVHDPVSLSLGQDFVEMRITEADGVTPVTGARLALTQDGRLAGFGISDEDGWTQLSISLESLDPVLITVTGENLYPWQSALPVLEDTLRLTCVGASVVGGGAVMPGTGLDLSLEVRNTGIDGIRGATATVSGPDGVGVVTRATRFGLL